MSVNIFEVAKTAAYFQQGILSKEAFEEVIFDYISDDKTIIPNMLRLLEIERQNSKELLKDCNMELSRSLTGLIDFSSQSEKDKKMRIFMIDEIKKFYKKWKHKVLCNYKIEGLE